MNTSEQLVCMLVFVFGEYVITVAVPRACMLFISWFCGFRGCYLHLYYLCLQKCKVCLLFFRYMGTITGISELDPVRWPNSHWRSVKVIEASSWNAYIHHCSLYPFFECVTILCIYACAYRGKELFWIFLHGFLLVNGIMEKMSI